MVRYSNRDPLASQTTLCYNTPAMSSKIHPTALIGKNVEIGVSNEIGPLVIIEDSVKIGCHNKIYAGAYLCSGTEIGNYNEIHMNTILGHAPQDLAFKGEPAYTKIGDDNILREFVTIHRGTKAETATVIGNSNYLMAYCHVAHNCRLGNHVIMVNQASLSGYCLVQDRAFISGMTGFHQFTRIGELAMVSALSASNKDIPPFMTCGGRPAVVLGVNTVGMKRAGLNADQRAAVVKAHKILYRSGLNVKQAVEAMRKEIPSEENVEKLIQFIEESKRGILDGAREVEETLKPRKSALADLSGLRK